MRAGGCLLAALLALAACADAALPPLPAAAPQARIDVGGVAADVRVVATATERRRGLMGVRTLRPNEGMLFVYRDARTLSIWMRGCLLALDVAFLDAAGTVLQVETLDPPAAPGEAPASARSSRPAAMVLEMPAGFFARHGFGPGTRITVPGGIDRARADP